MKVCLVQPPVQIGSAMSSYPPLGLLSNAASWMQQGHDVTFIDMLVNQISLKDFQRHLENVQPDIVGVTCLTTNSFNAYQVAEAAKQTLPESRVVLGGQHATGLATAILERYPFVDSIIRGEGEHVQLQQKKRIFDGPAVQNLDELPFPARHIAPMKKYFEYTKQLPHLQDNHTQIMASRGCPMNCNFCSSSRFWGFKCRMRTPENILLELRHLHDQYGVNDFRFFDDTINLNRQWLLKLCDLLIESKLNLKWQALARVNNADQELLNKMAEAGCYILDFGIESGSSRILKRIGKRISLHEAYTAINNAKQAGMLVRTFFVVGLPDETKEDLQLTLRAIINLPSDYFALAVCMLFPNSDLSVNLPEQEWFKPRPSLDFVQENVPIYHEPEREHWNTIAKIICSRAHIAKLEGYEHLQQLTRNKKLVMHLPFMTERATRKAVESHQTFLKNNWTLAVDTFGKELLLI